MPLPHWLLATNRYDEEGQLIPWHLQVLPDPEDRWRCEWYRGSFHLAKCVVTLSFSPFFVLLFSHIFSFLQVTDAVVQLLQPVPERPLEIVVHSFSSKRLRRQWLTFDMLCSTVDGSFDGRLFSLRPPLHMPKDDRYDIMVNFCCETAVALLPLTLCSNCIWMVPIWILCEEEPRVRRSSSFLGGISPPPDQSL